jgi:DNA-binding MarR family transcriptional regulator
MMDLRKQKLDKDAESAGVLCAFALFSCYPSPRFDVKGTGDMAARERSAKAVRRQNAAALPIFQLDSHVFYLFTQIFGRRNRDLAEKLKPFRITVPKWRVLAVLSERPGITMNRLAELTTVDRTTLTRTLDQMARGGLVERRGDARDRRSVRLHLTEQGQEAFRLVLPSVVEQNERALLGLSEAELAALRDTLHRMVRNLDPLDDSRGAAEDTA